MKEKTRGGKRARRGETRERVVIGIDLTKCPRPWLPGATNTVSFTARIYKCVPGKGWVYPGPAKRISFKLVATSSEKGICLNKGKSKNPDLWFPRQNGFILADDATVDALCEHTILGRPNPPHKHFQSATTRKAVTTATIKVRSEDFGSFGFIEASAARCVQIPPRERSAKVACPSPSCCEGSNRVKIPRDDNGNNIADIAPQDAGGAPATNDLDSVPAGDGHVGDGFSNYEEYRGFFVRAGANDVHIRTDIAAKDIFIRDVPGQGIGYFGQMGLTVHFVSAQQISKRNVINFNRGFATKGPQHGLRLVSEALGGALGYCFGTGPGTPRTSTRVAVDPAAHHPPLDIANTRAHELGHGVNVFHHGQLTLIVNPANGRREIDPRGGLTSGAVECVMRYDNYARFWRWPAPQTDHQIPRPEVPGTTFCASNLGTGVNDQPGNQNNQATRGNCRGQMRVNDH